MNILFAAEDLLRSQIVMMCSFLSFEDSWRFSYPFIEVINVSSESPLLSSPILSYIALKCSVEEITRTAGRIAGFLAGPVSENLYVKDTHRTAMQMGTSSVFTRVWISTSFKRKTLPKY